MCENPPGGLTCRSVNKKGIYTIEKFSLYFTHLPRSPQWTDLHEILHGGSSRRRNHLFQILCRSVEGFRICVGSNSAILPLLSRSPLTQGWRYRAACDTYTVMDGQTKLARVLAKYQSPIAVLNVKKPGARLTELKQCYEVCHKIMLLSILQISSLF